LRPMKCFRKFLLLLAGLVAGQAAFAQVQLTTKKEKLSDFTQKTIMVVLSGNDFLDVEIRDAVKNSWTMSPYEFCRQEEFKARMGDENYYFMVPVDVVKGDDAGGITYLSIVKGKKDAKSIDDMLDVVSFPVCPSGNPTGREAYMLPSFVDILQAYIKRSLSLGFIGGVTASPRPEKGVDYKLYITEDDLSDDIDEKFRAKRMKNKAEVVSSQKQASLMEQLSEGALVGYSIIPSDPKSSSLCYKIVVDARTHELFYFKWHKYSSGKGAFLREDVKKVLSSI